MTEPKTLQRAFEPTAHLLDWLLRIAPQALLCVVVLATGLVGALLAGRLVRWGVVRLKLDALAERVGVARLLYAAGVRRSLAALLGSMASYTVLLLTAHTLAGIIGLPGLSEVLGAIMARLPSLMAAVGVLGGGLLVAEALRRVLERLLRAQDAVDSPVLIAQGVYYLCVVLSVTMATEQLGLQVALIHDIILIMVGAGCASAALAFALSARFALTQIIARHHVKQLYRVGDRLQVDGVEGVVESFAAVSLCLKTSETHVNLPYQRLLDAAVIHTRRVARASQEP